MKLNTNQIIALACEVYGSEKQMRKAQEECGELIVAINHFLEGRKGGLENVIEETADVLLVANELRKIVGPRKVDEVFKAKVARLNERVRHILKGRAKRKLQTVIDETEATNALP